MKLPVRRTTGLSLGPTDLKRLHREWRRRPTGRLALVLDNVNAPFNVGSILRTAAALRVDHLWLAGRTAAPDHARTGKTALGAERYLKWTACENAADAIKRLRSEGYRTVALELAAGAVPLHDAELDGDVGLVLGHEDRGVSREGLTACDQVAFVPQLGRIGSLNVAVAAALAMYEVRRRSWTA